MEELASILDRLSFADLELWAGKPIVDRGRTYLKRVEGLHRTREDDLVAWVSGTEDYATLVRLDPGNRHAWYCTCPYEEGPCKHAVAVILSAARHIKAAREIPLLKQDDDLSLILFGDPEDDLAWAEEEEHVLPQMMKPDSSVKKGTSRIRRILEKMSREELLALVVGLAKTYPAIEQSLHEAEQLRTGQVEPMVRALHREISRLSGEPAWRNHWNQEGYVPDYSQVRNRLRALLNAGHYDHVLDVGEDLWQQGLEQIEMADDNGETAGEISECLDIVLKSLTRSSLTRPRQLLWVIERTLADEYGLLKHGEQVLDDERYTPSDWQEVAEVLERRLTAAEPKRSANYADRFQQKELVDRLIDAYRRGGSPEKIVPLLEQEVEHCANYDQLVDYLLGLGDFSGARKWCIQGFQQTIAKSPGFALALQGRLRAMAEHERRTDLVAAYRAQDFFYHPSLDAYKELRRSLEKSGLWPEVREKVLAYLETGRRPDLATKQGATGDWPLPEPEVSFPLAKERTVSFPRVAVLIDIAIAEKRMDDVVRLYGIAKKNTAEGWSLGERVAQAVAKSHPDVALAIWRETVDRLIAQVNPSAYRIAGGFLRQMYKVYEAGGRQAEWRALLGELRRTHKAKRRLLEVLDTLSGAGKKSAS